MIPSGRIRRTAIMQSRKAKLEQIADLMLRSDNAAIFPHTGADGDCLGAGNALKAALETSGRRTFVITDMPLVQRYLFLPLSEEAVIYDGSGPGCFMKELFGSKDPDLAVLDRKSVV